MGIRPATPDLEAVRQDLSRFIRELGLEYYTHFSGQKEKLEIGPIYERYGHLFSRDLARNCLNRRELADNPEEKRTWKHLHQFAFNGHIGDLTKGIVESLAKRQGEMTVTVKGEEIRYHSIYSRLINETDRETRREIDDEQAKLEVELDKLRLEKWHITHDVYREFGYSSYAEGCRSVSGVDYDWLSSELGAFLEKTRDAYAESFDKFCRERLGYPLAEASKCDMGYLMRGEGWDSLFPGEGMARRASAFLSDLGMPIEMVPAVRLDIEEREKKRPRAFCQAVEVGREVYVCVRPTGGLSDYLTFLHELGHAYHFAHTDPEMPSELTLVGDSATSEIFAFSFNYLGSDPAWLQAFMKMGDPSPIVEFLRLQKLYMLRRYASKFLYELELHKDYKIEGRQGLYPEYLNAGLVVSHRPEHWLYDLDDAFYSAGYLRAWIFEMQMRDYLKKEFGEDWWRNPAAGELLRRYWGTGRMYMPEEMAYEMCDKPLDLGPVTNEVLTSKAV
jgi:hypothetical protein